MIPIITTASNTSVISDEGDIVHYSCDLDRFHGLCGAVIDNFEPITDADEDCEECLRIGESPICPIMKTLCICEHDFDN